MGATVLTTLASAQFLMTLESRLDGLRTALAALAMIALVALVAAGGLPTRQPGSTDPEAAQGATVTPPGER